MPQPTPYNRLYNFTDFQTVNPTKPLPATSLDSELNAVELTLDQVLANMALVQRDDGALANNVVTPDSLSAAALAMIHQGEYTPRGAWALSVAYQASDLVTFNAATYLCLVAHTSTASFATDTAAGKWLLIANGALQGGGQAVDTFTGNGTTTSFTLTYQYQGNNAAVVFVGGVAQIPSQDFTISGSTITFVTAPPSPNVAGRKNVMVRGTGIEAQLAADQAATAAANAQGYATTAQSSQAAASSSQTAAATSAASAATSASSALSSASTATTQATTATNKASEASASAASASTSATQAAASATSSAASSSTSSTKASEAAASAAAASSSSASAATSASTATAKASEAAASASQAALSAGNSANSASSSAASASIALTQASSASDSASSASTHATSASASATTATTKSSEASASAQLSQDWAVKTTGAVSGGQYSAKYHAQLAADSSTAAAASATASQSSATQSASSATAAASAKTAAEAARDATLAAFDSFDDRYLGAKSSDPSLDNDGNAILAGALYYNTTAGAMNIYTGSSWVAAYVSGTDFLPFSGGTMTGAITFAPSQTFDPAKLSDATPITKGGTGATTAAAARSSLGVPATDGTGASGSWGISITGNAATSTSAGSSTTAGSAAKVVAANWTIEEVSGVLYFKYGGVNKAKLDSSGNFTVAGNVSGYSTV